MKNKTLFVAIQVALLAIVGVIISTVAIASSHEGFRPDTQSTTTEQPYLIIQTDSPQQMSTAPTADVPEQATTPNDNSGEAPNSSNPRYGKTNEESPLYQQCLLDLQAARADYDTKTAQHNNYLTQINAEYMSVTSQASNFAYDSPEFLALSQRATELMGMMQSGSNPYTIPPAVNWGCGYSGRFNF